MEKNDTPLGMLSHNYIPQIVSMPEILERANKSAAEAAKIERAKEIDDARREKEIDRKADRKFLWVVTLVSAIIGAIVGSAITIGWERFFK